MIGTRTTESFKWGAAVLASLLIHATLLWQHNTVLYSSDGKQLKQSGITRLSFRTLATPKPKQEILPVPPEPKQVIQEKKPKPPPEPVRKVRKKKAIKQPRPKPPIENKIPQEAAPPAPSSPTADEPVLNEQARKNYLGSLAAHIESYKFYPRTARRRGVQGIIKISFRLLENGNIADLEIGKGHKLLRNAAEQALQHAQPLPPPPRGMNTPIQVSYGMEYRLR